jgi:hypothetical protein
MKLIRFIPFLFVGLLSFQSDEATDTLVEWDSERPLTWKDFSGEIDRQSPYDAWTYSGINYVYSWFYEGDAIKVDLDAYAFFDPAQSWIKKGEESAELLQHEQLHFDLSELHSRYFEVAVRDFAFTENVEAELDSLYTVYLNKLLATQIQYDEETKHFQDKKEQARWHQFVADELKQLE